ncbi:MAG: DNA polymerase beta superfamily protein [Planctomycetota bacterium]
MTVVIDLNAHTIFITLAGSHAHGTARADSDIDLRGVCIAPLSARVSLRGTFEQHEGALDAALLDRVLPRLRTHATAVRAIDRGIECAIFELAKFFALCANANPNALEILFADEADWVLETPAWRRLHAERRRFLSRKVESTFLGYALQQLKRIKSHRAWLLSPPAAKPTRQAFGLPEQGTLHRQDRERIEQAVGDKLRDWGIDNIEMPSAARSSMKERLESFWRECLASSEKLPEDDMKSLAEKSLGLPAETVALLGRERKYRAALRNWDSYQTWLASRNPARARLEAQFGYDTKHAAHLVRLMQTGLELSRTGELHVRRPNATELVAIRDGALSYEQLVAEAERLQADLSTKAALSVLPEQVDLDALDALLCELVQASG